MEEVKSNNSYPDYFLKSEVERILNAAQLIPEAYYFCKFLWRTGMRVSEALEIKLEDVNFQQATISVQTKKRRTSHQREVPVSSEFLAELSDYIKGRGICSNMRLFAFTSRTAFNYVNKACLNADLKDGRGHPSSFRHSYAIHCLINGLSIDTVNSLLGNRDIKKTMRYMRIVNQDEEKFKQIVW